MSPVLVTDGGGEGMSQPKRWRRLDYKERRGVPELAVICISPEAGITIKNGPGPKAFSVHIKGPTEDLELVELTYLKLHEVVYGDEG